jgi:limonene 1,2-monooxygenase
LTLNTLPTVPSMRFGVFIAPYHSVRDSPTLGFRRDLELVEWCDELGFDEAWFGEHHSAGSETIGSPELMIAAAGERTRRIRLGTGVSSLPYHHPFVLADRFVQLDHMTMGRAMLGVGPGALPGDAYMMGIETTSQRPMMEECLEAILALWAYDEPVSMRGTGFTLHEARLQMRPHNADGIPVAVAATFSPSGPQLAGRFGTGLMSIAATQAKAFDVLARHWRTAQEAAEIHGTTVSRDNWRLVGPMHLAETEEQARRDAARGLEEWVSYFRKVGAVPILGDLDVTGDLVDAVNSSGVGVIGTPDMAIAQLERLAAQSGGYGTYLLMAHDWANRRATLDSYELFARYVMPRFTGATETLVSSRDWTIDNRHEFIGNATKAIQTATESFKRLRAERAEATRD